MPKAQQVELEVFAAYGPRGPRPKVDCSKDLPLTSQSEAAACDINRIVATFHRTGVLPPLREGGEYVDVSGFTDLREQIDRVRVAREVFETFPALMREKYQNDPAFFWEAITLEENYADAVTLGLAEARSEEASKADSGKSDSAGTP